MSCEILGKSESGSSGAGLWPDRSAHSSTPADNGAVICQNSWGYTRRNHLRDRLDTVPIRRYSRAMEYFNKYAGTGRKRQPDRPDGRRHRPFAAGNDASSEVCYPAADANVISVGATAFTGAPAYYTNYGTWGPDLGPGRRPDHAEQRLRRRLQHERGRRTALRATKAARGPRWPAPTYRELRAGCQLLRRRKTQGPYGRNAPAGAAEQHQSVDRYCTGKYQQYPGNMGIGSLDTYQAAAEHRQDRRHPGAAGRRGRHRQHRPWATTSPPPMSWATPSFPTP